MKSFWTRNIDRKGRLMRASMGVALLVGAALAWEYSHLIVATLLALGGLFAVVEALRGWCLLRACGLKTRF